MDVSEIAARLRARINSDYAIEFPRSLSVVSISHLRAILDDRERARERLQAIIDWCDLAMSNPKEFNSHGVRNLDGPVFDAARDYLAGNEVQDYD